MTRSLLRKRRPPSTSKHDSLRPSLSLPDLTTPLLDPASWEELPSFTTTFSPHTLPGSQHRQPSLVPSNDSPGSPVRFHRPFTPWQVVNTYSSEKEPIKTGGEVSNRTEGLGISRRKTKGKELERLNVVVAGGRGVGKTSFVNLLVDSLRTASSQTRNEPSVGNRFPTETPPTPSSVTSPGAPKPSTPTSPSTRRHTSRISSRFVTVSLPAYERRLLRLTDTPGLDLASRAERERGVECLLNILEDRFDERLNEESKIVRKGLKADDGMVHLGEWKPSPSLLTGVIYLFDGRSVLRPEPTSPVPLVCDWRYEEGFEDQELRVDVEQAVETPKLASTEIDTIRRIATRTNVLPVITHADLLTLSELDAVRCAVRRDLRFAFTGDSGGGFGVFCEEEEEDRKTPTPDTMRSSDSVEMAIEGGRRSHRLSTVSTCPSHRDRFVGLLPFAIFSPEPSDIIGERRFIRRYAWGEADVTDPKQSDFLLLRDTVLGFHAKVLRATTKDVLYERYRTERLLAERTVKG